MVIDKFDDEFAFLSNFYPASVSMDGMTFQNSEAAYQAQKCLNAMDKFQFCNLSPRDAKKLGRKVQLRPDWANIKDEVMAQSKIQTAPRFG